MGCHRADTSAWNRVLKRCPASADDPGGGMTISGKTVEIAFLLPCRFPRNSGSPSLTSAASRSCPGLPSIPATSTPLPQVLRYLAQNHPLYCQQLLPGRIHPPFCRFPVWATALSTSLFGHDRSCSKGSNILLMKSTNHRSGLCQRHPGGLQRLPKAQVPFIHASFWYGNGRATGSLHQLLCRTARLRSNVL